MREQLWALSILLCRYPGGFCLCLGADSRTSHVWELRQPWNAALRGAVWAVGMEQVGMSKSHTVISKPLQALVNSRLRGPGHVLGELCSLAGSEGQG